MLTLQFIPYSEIENLDVADRIKKIMGIINEDKILVMEGRLKKTEEAELIKATMEKISQKFKGIEISVVYPEARRGSIGNRVKSGLADMLLGERQGLTVIGPATLVKEIRKDPDKIQLFTTSKRLKKG